MKMVTVNLILFYVMVLFMKTTQSWNDVNDLLCSRIYFKHDSEKVFPFTNALTGIYVKTNKVFYNFPVYQNERGSVYFYYNGYRERFYFGKTYGRYEKGIGLTAYPSTFILNSSSRWKSTIDNDTKPLGDILGLWEYTLNSKVFAISGSVIPKCVPQAMTDCGSKPVIFTTHVTMNGSYIHNMTVNNFNPVPDKFQYHRRVYEHDTMDNFYLFFHSAYWIIGDNPKEMNGWYSVKSNAAKPEFITESWRFFDNGWKDFDAKIQCRGEQYERCAQAPCYNSATGVCNMNSLNETMCTCKYGYEGDRCQTRTRDICSSRTLSNPDLTINREEGALTMELCPNRAIRVLLCQDYNNTGLNWYGGYICPTARPTTTTRSPRTPWPTSRPSPATTTTTTTRSPWTPRPRRKEDIDLDKDEVLSYTIRVLVILIPILLSIFHLCCFYCYRKSKDEELYRKICSLCSLHAYFGVLVWFVFIICFLHYKLYKYGKNTFGDICAAAAFFVICGYVYVLIESCLSSVMGYLETSLDVADADAFIKSLLEQRPTVVTTAQCYHWETQTRQVSYTDANGNTQYRTETYQEKVVTWVGSDSFNFTHWKDNSDSSNIPAPKDGEILRVKLSKQISFANEETKHAFYEQLNNFKEENRYRDTHIEHETSYDIPNYKEHVLSYDSEQGLPFWMNTCCFILWTCFCLSWPYRWLIRFYSTKKCYEITKEISLTPFAPPVLQQPPATAPPAYFMQPTYPPPCGDLPPSYHETVQMENVHQDQSL